MHALWDGSEHTDLVAGSGIEFHDRGAMQTLRWGRLQTCQSEEVVEVRAENLIYPHDQPICRSAPEFVFGGSTRESSCTDTDDIFGTHTSRFDSTGAESQPDET